MRWRNVSISFSGTKIDYKIELLLRINFFRSMLFYPPPVGETSLHNLTIFMEREKVKNYIIIIILIILSGLPVCLIINWFNSSKVYICETKHICFTCTHFLSSLYQN